MPTNSMLSIRPDYEFATRYGAAWLTHILNASDSAGLNYVDLYKEQATAENFFYSLETLDPMIVNILGHGLYNLILVKIMNIYLLEVLIQTFFLGGLFLLYLVNAEEIWLIML